MIQGRAKVLAEVACLWNIFPRENEFMIVEDRCFERRDSTKILRNRGHTTETLLLMRVSSYKHPEASRSCKHS